MDHHRISAAKAALIVALIGFDSSAQASVTWEIVGVAPGESDIVGTVTTPDIPVSCSLGPPTSCPISGTVIVPTGAMGGPGTTIDLGVDPANVIISISASPPAPGDDFFVFDISKDGYDCTTSNSLVLQCDFDLTTVSYDLELTEQVPKVVIGNGNVVITGQLEIAGQIFGGAEPTLYSIGDIGPAGGKVFYVTNGGLHGLEVAPIDHPTNVMWGCPGTAISGADGTAIGTGAQNTVDIIAGCPDSEEAYAARFANSYSLNGFDDWFLPSKDELNQLYLQRQILDGIAFGDYWTSTEVSSSSAWIQRFIESDPGQGALSRGDSSAVRAIRAF